MNQVAKVSLNKIAIAILTSICLIVITEATFITSVKAVTQDFQWHGLNGYSVTGTYSYESKGNKRIIREKGKGQTELLKSLKIRFYDPSGKLLYSHNDIANGISQGQYFEFSLDEKTQELLDNIDLGGESSGELFLKGNVNKGLSLTAIDSFGKEYLLDRD